MIQSIRQRGQVGGLAGLVMFAALLLLPCLCSSAWAQDMDQDEGCCPSTVDEEQGQGGDEAPGMECCCEEGGCKEASSAVADGSEVVMSENLLTVTPPESDLSDWVPTVLAVMWLAQRLEVMTYDAGGAEVPQREQVQPDGRSTYLNHEILLI